MRSAQFVILITWPGVACWAAVAQAQSPEQIDTYAAFCRAERSAAIIQTYQAIDRLERDRKTPKAEREQYVRNCEAELGRLENPLAPYFAKGNLSLAAPEVGQMGSLDSQRVRVFQVIDATNALVEYVMFKDGPRVRSTKTAFGVPAYTVESNKLHWITGVDTGAYVDGRTIELQGVFAVSGTKTYDTDEGTQTVPMLKLIEIRAHQDKFTRKDDVRKWTSANGGHTTEAIFVRYKGGDVTLMRPDGKSLDVPLAKLSNEDRDYVRDWLKVVKAR